VVALLACSHSPAGSGSGQGPATGSGTGAPAPQSAVVLKAGASTTRVRVEVVRTPEDRARGLMFRKQLPQSQGMLFIFDTEEIQSFWMENTYIPLDMIFIDAKLEVVGVVENAAPLTRTSRKVDTPSLYVLEVNAGFARQHGIGKGTKVTLEGVSR
jgi:uncharacterized protein